MDDMTGDRLLAIRTLEGEETSVGLSRSRGGVEYQR
jgi:hypothetical protein